MLVILELLLQLKIVYQTAKILLTKLGKLPIRTILLIQIVFRVNKTVCEFDTTLTFLCFDINLKLV